MVSILEVNGLIVISIAPSPLVSGVMDNGQTVILLGLKDDRDHKHILAKAYPSYQHLNPYNRAYQVRQ
jgi:hypothetical protein